jgi:hypothetical protein
LKIVMGRFSISEDAFRRRLQKNALVPVLTAWIMRIDEILQAGLWAREVARDGLPRLAAWNRIDLPLPARIKFG